MRTLRIIALAGIASAAALCQETPAAPASSAPLAFEVASIKPSEPMTAMGGGKMMFRFGVQNDGAMVTYSHMTLRSLVVSAYRVKDYQVSGGASWVDQQPWDIHAKLPEGASKDQAPEMLQTLLQERFKVTLHHEKKDHNIYALVAAKGGPKLKVADPDATFTMPNGLPMPPPPPRDGGVSAPTTFGPSGKTSDGAAAARAGANSGGGEGRMMMRMGPNGGHLDGRGMTLQRFSEMLGQYVDRPVINETGIDGKYDFSIDISQEDLANTKMMHSGNAAGMIIARTMSGPAPAASHAEALPDAPEGGSIFQSIQSYGLKLEAKKAPLDTIIIDSAAKTPIEN